MPTASFNVKSLEIASSLSSSCLTLASKSFSDTIMTELWGGIGIQYIFLRICSSYLRRLIPSSSCLSLTDINDRYTSSISRDLIHCSSSLACSSLRCILKRFGFLSLRIGLFDFAASASEVLNINLKDQIVVLCVVCKTRRHPKISI